MPAESAGRADRGRLRCAHGWRARARSPAISSALAEWSLHNAALLQCSNAVQLVAAGATMEDGHGATIGRLAGAAVIDAAPLSGTFMQQEEGDCAIAAGAIHPASKLQDVCPRAAQERRAALHAYM